jgi:ASC-1-like (ASCH) protein
MKTHREHHLKTDPEQFDAVKFRQKKFEIRFDDRHFQVGDKLVLKKTKYSAKEMQELHLPLVYTGDEIRCEVTHMLHGPIYGLEAGWVIMSIQLPEIP